MCNILCTFGIHFQKKSFFTCYISNSNFCAHFFFFSFLCCSFLKFLQMANSDDTEQKTKNSKGTDSVLYY